MKKMYSPEELEALIDNKIKEIKKALKKEIKDELKEELSQE